MIPAPAAAGKNTKNVAARRLKQIGSRKEEWTVVEVSELRNGLAEIGRRLQEMREFL